MGVDAQLLLVASSSGCERLFEVVVASGRSATTTSWMLEAVCNLDVFSFVGTSVFSRRGL